MYFIADAEGEYIKIGYTTKDIHTRLAQIQTGNPKKLQLVGWMQGNRGTERLMQERFKMYHAHGEWFHYTSGMYDKLVNMPLTMFKASSY